jgi:leader peptidase (prepilin peptidase)/N-methyltransferase
MLRLLATLFAGLSGLAFGSFLNVCLSRWPAGESVVKPASHCRSCGRTLSWWENIPLLSWLALRGRCRTCKAAISWRYPLVELAVGVLWALIAWRLFSQFEDRYFGPGFSMGPPHFGILPAFATMVFVWLLVGVAVLDAEHFWIANAITVPGIALGIALSFWFDGWMKPPFALDRFFWISFGERLLEILAAAGLILLIRWIYWIVRRREGVGLGDAKLMAMLAAWLGLPGALLSFAIGVVLGAFVALVVIALPKSDSSESRAAIKLPLGTFLCIAGIISALWGQQIIAAYLRYSGL